MDEYSFYFNGIYISSDVGILGNSCCISDIGIDFIRWRWREQKIKSQSSTEVIFHYKNKIIMKKW
jgi:hypothetical protein